MLTLTFAYNPSPAADELAIVADNPTEDIVRVEQKMILPDNSTISLRTFEDDVKCDEEVSTLELCAQKVTGFNLENENFS